jgi:hypothetical protein
MSAKSERIRSRHAATVLAEGKTGIGEIGVIRIFYEGTG